MSAEATQLVVLGAGPGGYAAAFLAADLGLEVTLVDPEPNPGGVCLFRGCIPSKALLHVARLIDEAREAEDRGVKFAAPVLDLERLRSWTAGVVARLTEGLGRLMRQREVTFLRGRGRLRDGSTLEVLSPSGEIRRLRFEHAILATGSQPVPLEGFPVSPRVFDSTSALALPEIPESLLVVGGGYIGLELGSVYAALGARVTIVELLDGLLPGVDRDLVKPLERRLADRLEAIHLGTRVTAAEEIDGGVRVELEGPLAAGDPPVFSRVLVSVGRRPNSSGLGLENTAVRIDDRGFVEVDAALRTAEPSIFAIGDLVGQPMLAHKASHEGRVAARVVAGQKAAFEPAAIPAVVFTDPEVAWCGLTEGTAREQAREVEVTRFPWGASGRALTLGRDDGLTKLVLEPGTGRILGVGLTGPGAGELIAEGALAVEMAAVAADLRLTIHPHPTLSETLMEAAEVFFGQSTHLHRPRRGRPPRSGRG